MIRSSTFDPPARQPASPVDPQGELFDIDIELPWSKGVLRPAEVARFLDVSEDQVKRLIDSGALEALSVSAAHTAERHHRRITARSLRAFVNARRRQAL